MAPKDRRPRNAGPSGSGSKGKQDEKLELLELGPEDSDAELLEFESPNRLEARIKVVGVGGGGGNALNTMIQSGLGGVEFVAANTDAQALSHNRAPLKLQLGSEVTRGLGAGANPEKGRAAALEARDRIRDMLTGADMVFVTAGLGGGTGTGAAPVIAEIAREVGALTVAVVTKPFQFEGRVRTRHAERGLDELRRVVDTLITIPNHRLLAIAGKGTSVRDGFRLADEVLYNAVKGISDLITVHGLINLDFADVRTIMNEMGMALMGTGVGSGDARATDAAHAAISSPLLEDLSIEGARGVLINVTGGPDMTLHEVNEAATLIQEAAHEEANIIFGAVIDDSAPEGELRVTVIATGLDDGRAWRAPDAPGRAAAAGPGARTAPLPLHGDAPAADAPPAAGFAGEPPRAAEPGAPRSDAEFVSPFEDEYDVPAFMRRRGAGTPDEAGDDSDDDRGLPAFLRRSAD